MERKLAAVLFADLVGSTTLVASADPEVVRRRVTRFFDTVSRCIESHGGTVEKFAGDAVMAAFGIPQAHEDDAERSVRAAIALLEAVHGLELEARVGIEAGEVVVDEAESTFATGEAVNVAARLQGEAAPGEVLIGPVAHRLTLGRFDVEERGELALRGFGRPVSAWRVVCAREQPARPAVGEAPFVGRDDELELLESTFERVVRNRRAHLFTVYGEPGVGKSRLAREFVAGLEGATVLAGRCLPYGEGITYWPLAEMVKVAAGIADDDPVQEAVGKLRACCGDDAVADLLGLAAGVLEAVEGERSQQEIAWAARQWAAELADAQPLVLVFEDIHWAEEPLLDLIDSLADRVRDAPLVILCLARPELLEVRPGWGGGRLRATAIELEPLAPAESEELVDALLADRELEAGTRGLVLDKTEGNPLFVEETVRMLVEQDGSGQIRLIPDTVQALIAARIDRLAQDARALLRRASVVGRVFWAGALGRLAPDIPDGDAILDDLLDREFVVPEARSTISGERAYRFKHVLIRDVAYAGLTKSARAELHTAVADWLAERAGDELLEIRAYHLDQAAALHVELDAAVPRELARDAAAALEEAGRRALAREANRSARHLLRRAVELEPTLERRFQAARAAWRLDDLPAVAVEMQAVLEDAREAGDTRLQGRALTALAHVSLLRDADLPRARALAEQALSLLGEDAAGRFDALALLSQIAWWRGDLGEHELHDRAALELAREIGRKDLESEAAERLAQSYVARGDVAEAEALIDRAFELAEEAGAVVPRAQALSARAQLLLTAGQLDAAEAAAEEARSLFETAGAAWPLARTLNWLAWIAFRRRDYARAERLFRDAVRVLKALEDRGTLCESQRGLAQALLAQGRIDEAERYALESRETVGPHDETSRATTRMALGLVRAAQGRDEEAEVLLREAVDIAAQTDYAHVRRETLSALVRFLHERGRDGVEPYEEELAALRAASTARIA